MAHPIEREYWVNIHTQGSAWTLRINDLKIWSYGRTGHQSISYPISTNIKNGHNTVSLIFAPLISQDPETGEFLQGPKPDFWVDVSIEAINTRTQEKERLNTLLLRYDMETGELVTYDEPVGSDRAVHETEHLRTNGEFHVSSPDILVLGSGESINAERVDMSFRVFDPIPDFHWRDEATELEDTPLMRHELRQAYQELYRLFEAGDTEAILRKAGPVWDRAGLLMAGGKSAREYSESMPIGSQLISMRREPDGPRLEPLRLADDPLSDSLEFMGNGRLVSIRPSPLRWSYPDQPNKEAHTMPFVFYRTAAGEWRIATID
ncbi:hypothetical protein [Billgrantia aerodenitrificans]|uniref:Uncharacterized protein n=1 Tax=Billgrantia aerodenitrificans TaxID=2733483 RepID=A0ABS9AQP7_9GAMM|nr:hypothetical protein [Halomonas aerodenitrificans]MCE8024170.1 hypothetical protein [Halomonas aerodenitrificans]